MDARLIAMAFEAQKDFAKSRYVTDGNYIHGRFIVLDMLDIIGAKLDANRTTKNPATQEETP